MSLRPVPLPLLSVASPGAALFGILNFDMIDTCFGPALTCVLGFNEETMRNCTLWLPSALRFLLCEIMSEMDDIEEFPKATALLHVPCHVCRLA